MNELVPPQIAAGLEAGRSKSNLAFALLCLPPGRRKDMQVFYEFCRTVDDIADSRELPEEEARRALIAWKAAIRGERPLPPDLERVVERYSIDRELLGEIVLGVEMDLETVRYETYQDLQKYCWRVASAVGLASLPILGANSLESRAYATALGMALQLTNIIRDIAEDARAGRVYLPTEDLERFGVAREEILGGQPTPGLRKLVEFEGERARALFQEAERRLPESDRRALRAPRIMAKFYLSLLQQMENDNFQVLTRRYRLSKAKKLVIALPILLESPN